MIHNYGMDMNRLPNNLTVSKHEYNDTRAVTPSTLHCKTAITITHFTAILRLFDYATQSNMV